MGIAGLWDVWKDPVKGPLVSFTLLTIKATSMNCCGSFIEQAMKSDDCCFVALHRLGPRAYPRSRGGT